MNEELNVQVLQSQSAMQQVQQQAREVLEQEVEKRIQVEQLTEEFAKERDTLKAELERRNRDMQQLLQQVLPPNASAALASSLRMLSPSGKNGVSGFLYCFVGSFAFFSNVHPEKLCGSNSSNRHCLTTQFALVCWIEFRT